ncbi:hypothetical protein MATR_04190 [Marivirga tractuosa]|uniref:DUF4209 domain-containing protein n=1 Tax=Marivirga tractuosa (strain ATCC 23168 / DSM 4126 / NBRC 15989 / NCIMB 1408 / VKM B-1430 / H-43) TaxID=643867 RepID=E4TTB7_MARTH|nr:DUF4209 domain-containing protein [Marivirga tractuosa]ADR21947.1 hypothetical protein Ftrac_1962 [Marivirga tractuosa DSM 4126]BDD13594.1 hypothetical protein MATR_04190 [Marivirga tractuosa]
MRTKDLDISKFTSLTDVHSYLDENASKLSSNWDITDLFVKYRDQTVISKEKQKAQWELECFLFEFRGLELMVFSYSFNEEKDEFPKYPNLDEFQSEAFEYIKKRAQEAKNALLIARYNHILWKGPKGIKNKKYAQVAIVNYLNAVRNFIELSKQKPDGKYLYQAVTKYELTCSLISECKEEVKSLKLLTSELLNDSEVSFWAKHSILDDMIKHPKIFKAEDFKGSLNLFKKELDGANKRTDHFLLVNNYLPTALRIASKTKSDNKYWYDQIGECYVQMANDEESPDRLWIKQDNYANAIDAFGNSGNIQRRKEIEQAYYELKPNVKLPSHRIEVKLSEEESKLFKAYEEETRQKIEWLLTLDPSKIYMYLSSSVYFPKFATIKEAVSNQKEKWMDMSRTIEFDSNKNIRSFQGGGSDKMYQEYTLRIQLSVLPFLRQIFAKGIKERVLTFENYLEFLKNSWLGKPYTEIDLGGDLVETNWIGLIAPSVVEYFVQSESSLNAKYYKPNYVLCIDSLTLKFEGLLRDFSSRLNISTSTRGKKGMQENYAHDILGNEIIKKYFDEDDRLLFEYLFLNEGLNIRNNVAHCFYNEKEYDLNKINLLLVTLLRISKYDFTLNKND